MSQVYNEEGEASPVTVLGACPITVEEIKSKEKDGYDAVKVGYGEEKDKKTKEFRLKEADSSIEKGVKFDASVFSKGDIVTVSSVSKGKGFQGVVKRHGFHGGRRSHGQKHSEREPGSIGSTGPQRVFKGVRMAGRMGGNRVTTKNLKVVDVDKNTNTILIKGAIAGRKGTLVEIVSK